MSNENVTPMKGFRSAPKPTKGQLEQENTTLGAELKQRLQGMQQFFGNMIQQVMGQARQHGQELQQLSIWLASAPTDTAAQPGDNLLMDYAGSIINEDGTAAELTLTDMNGTEHKVPDLFDGGNGEMFILARLGNGTLITGFEEQLVGLKAGEGREITVQFPKDYGVASLQDKKVKFVVYVHEVRRPYSTSPVGQLIQENARLRNEQRAKAVADAQAAAKAKADASAPPAETPVAATEAPATDTPPATA